MFGPLGMARDLSHGASKWILNHMLHKTSDKNVGAMVIYTHKFICQYVHLFSVLLFIRFILFFSLYSND